MDHCGALSGTRVFSAAGRYSDTKAQPLPKVASSAGHSLAMLAGVGRVLSSTQRSRAAISVG